MVECDALAFAIMTLFRNALRGFLTNHCFYAYCLQLHLKCTTAHSFFEKETFSLVSCKCMLRPLAMYVGYCNAYILRV